MVFQSYALYPHMTVRKNIGYPLKLAGVPAHEAQAARRCGGAHAAARGGARSQARAALGWPAPAGGDGQGDRPQAIGVLDGRAVVEPRCQAARADARRDLPAATRVQDHDRLRHPRSGRGDDDGRSRCRAQRRPGRAMRSAPRSLRPAGQPVRRRVHRLAVDELLLGHGRTEGRRAGRRRWGRPSYGSTWRR